MLLYITKTTDKVKKIFLKSDFVFTLALTELWLPFSPQPLMDFMWRLLGTIWNSKDLGWGLRQSLQAQNRSRRGARQEGREARYVLEWISLSFIPGMCNTSCIAGTKKDAQSWKWRMRFWLQAVWESFLAEHLLSAWAQMFKQGLVSHTLSLVHG